MNRQVFLFEHIGGCQGDYARASRAKLHVLPVVGSEVVKQLGGWGEGGGTARNENDDLRWPVTPRKGRRRDLKACRGGNRIPTWGTERPAVTPASEEAIGLRQGVNDEGEVGYDKPWAEEDIDLDAGLASRYPWVRVRVR